MASLASILLSAAIGWLLVYRFAGLAALRPRWAAWLLIFGAGAALGIAIASCLFFLLLLLFPGVAHLALWVRLALLIAAGYVCFRGYRPGPPPAPAARYPYVPLLWIALAAALCFVTLGMSAAWEANPHGDWDAWSIWNLRAKFLAAGDGLASRAWSADMPETHLVYPLLLSGFIASCWADAGGGSPAAPIATAYVFLLALLAMVAGGVAVLRGPVGGLLAGLCLTGVPTLLHEVPSQYADIPLACFLAGAVLAALLDRPALAGALAGCAAWTKDEGILFVLVLAAAMALVKRPRLARFCVGAAPAAALVLVFKLAMARAPHTLMSGVPGGLAHRLVDLSRYRTAAWAMLREIFTWNVGWYHPLLPVAILLIALRTHRRGLRDALFSAGVGLAVLLGYFGIYVVTPNDLQWQLQTSLTRLFIQVWPIGLIAAFLAMRMPQPVPAAAPAPVNPKPRRKGRS